MLATVLRRARGAQPESGASAVEYGLLVAAVAAMIVAVSFLLGSAVRGGFQSAVTAFDSADGGASTTYNVAGEDGGGVAPVSP